MMATFAIHACKGSVPQSDGSHQDHYKFLIAPTRPILFQKKHVNAYLVLHNMDARMSLPIYKYVHIQFHTNTR